MLLPLLCVVDVAAIALLVDWLSMLILFSVFLFRFCFTLVVLDFAFVTFGTAAASIVTVAAVVLVVVAVVAVVAVVR